MESNNRQRRCFAGVLSTKDLRPDQWHTLTARSLDIEPRVRRENMKILTKRIVVIASWVVEIGADSEEFVISSAPLLFWSPLKQRYVSFDEVSPPSADALISEISNGTIIPALNFSFGIVKGKSETIRLFSSVSGGATAYSFSSKDDGIWSFADCVKQLTQARDSKLDRLGVGEVIRFGANYGSRTPIAGLQRVPFGHFLTRTGDAREVINSYADFTYLPEEGLDEDDIIERTKKALIENLSCFSKHTTRLLYSGGVDSSLLLALGKQSGTVRSSTFLSMSADDPQNQHAFSGAKQLAVPVDVVQLSQEWDQIERAIRDYSLPTLDFSIISTFQAGVDAVDDKHAEVLVDGTGGDAWFGFQSLKHAWLWRKIHPILYPLRGVASKFYAQSLERNIKRVQLPFMLAARMPTQNVASLAHLCANPAYRYQLDLSSEEWDEIEDSLFDFMQSLSKNAPSDDHGQVIVSDATMIAMAQFSAKTSQWSLKNRSYTVLPFCMPNIVDIGRRLPASLLCSKDGAKPLLKKLTVMCGLDSSHVYRKKSGFQPPLQQMLSSSYGKKRTLEWLDQDDELSAIWSNDGSTLIRRLLLNDAVLDIKSLYPIWGLLSMRVWLNEFRSPTVY